MVISAKHAIHKLISRVYIKLIFQVIIDLSYTCLIQALSMYFLLKIYTIVEVLNKLLIYSLMYIL